MNRPWSNGNTLLVAGRWSSAARHLMVRNPARPDEVVGTIARSTPGVVHEAVLAARKAQPDWASWSALERATMLERALDRLDENSEGRAVLLSRENGKPLSEARGECLGVAKRQRMALRFAEQLDRETRHQSSGMRTSVRHRPYGVVASIVPWNAPLSLGFIQIVAALLTGNSVVLKPPETAPLALIDAVGAFAGVLPPGVINVVTGLPGEIGEALTTHPGIDKIGFTGSIPAARAIMANASGTLKGLTFELGGNDPAILLDDLEPGPAVVEALTKAAFLSTGQVCMAIKRVYVPRTKVHAVAAALADAASDIVVGEGLDPAVTMGPLHTAGALARARALLDDARSHGADVVTVGRSTPDVLTTGGYFMQPSIVTDLPPDARLVMEEQFCPALPVVGYDTVEEAIAQANVTIFGLAASIWSNDVDRALRLAPHIEAGQVWINAHGTHALNHDAPYGGLKQSGSGRKSGIEGLREYQQSQTITMLSETA